MITVFIARRDAHRARQTQARLEASREVRVLGVAHSLYRAQLALPGLDPDTLLVDLRLEDGAALSLVRGLRERQAERPKVMLVAAQADDPLLFSTLVSGADAYLLEPDLRVAASMLHRLAAGEATMAAPIAAQVLRFFGQDPLWSPPTPSAADRRLDWSSQCVNPLQLSAGELRLVQLISQDLRSGEVAAWMAVSLEAIGRRIAHIYRKLSWDVRSGSLSLLAA